MWIRRLLCRLFGHKPHWLDVSDFLLDTVEKDEQAAGWCDRGCGVRWSLKDAPRRKRPCAR